MNKVERKPGIALPPVWCGPICRNSMQDVCVKKCAVNRDCSHFEIKKGITLEALPNYPVNQTKDMTKEEKFTSMAVYVAKIGERLKEVENGYDPNCT